MTESTQKQNIIPSFINVAEVARRMGKKKEWVYQRLNGYTVNKKVATFKTEDLEQLKIVLLEMLVELGNAIGIEEMQTPEFESHRKMIQMLSDTIFQAQMDCIQRLVTAFSFDKGAEDISEQIAALNEAQRILNPAPPSNCKEVDVPPNPTDQ